MKITLGNGANTLVVFAGSAVGDDLTVKSGSGADTLTLSGPVSGNVEALPRRGRQHAHRQRQPSATTSPTRAARAPRPSRSAAPWEARPSSSSATAPTRSPSLDATPIGEALKIKGGTGSDTISLGNLPIGEDANLNLSAGDNTVSLTDTTVGENLIVKGKSGNDTVTFTGTVTIGEETKFSLDGGTNTTP